MSKKIVIRLPRFVIDDETGRNIVLNKFEKHYVESDSGLQTKDFILSKKDLEKNGAFTKDKNDFVIFDTCFIDNYKRIKRLAQIITLKDVGSIIANTGLNKNSIVLDSGSGSGGLSCYLASFVSRVDSFDIHEEHLAVARLNAKNLGFSNVSYEKGDIYVSEDFKEEEYDCFTLDVPQPWDALDTAVKVLKVGGFLVVYAPHIDQIQKVVTALPSSLIVEKTIELIEREWNVSEKTLRPATKDFSHTAFLCFIRKIKRLC